jgi:hypothetical protein
MMALGHNKQNYLFDIYVTQRMQLVEQELLTLPAHLSSSLVFVGFMLLNLQFSV